MTTPTTLAAFNTVPGVDLPRWEALSPIRYCNATYHGFGVAWDDIRFVYMLVNVSNSTASTGALTTQLWFYDMITDSHGLVANATGGSSGMDLEYDSVRNVLYVINGNAATTWQVFNLNYTAVTIANVSCAARAFTSMTPVLPAAAAGAGASILKVDDLSVTGALTVGGGAVIDTGVVTTDPAGSATTRSYVTEASGTFGAGMIGLYIRVTKCPSIPSNVGLTRLITGVTNARTITYAALPFALSTGDEFAVIAPEMAITSGTTTTLTVTGAAWTANTYRDADVIILTGTYANQRRRIASHTTDTITLATAVTGNPRTGALAGAPAAGDVIRIVPSSDFLYYQPGGSTATFYRIDVVQTTGAAWSASLGTIPGTVGGGGNTFHAGKYSPFNIFCLRGNGSSSLYQYAIGLASWTTLTVYNGETVTTGSSSTMLHGYRKIFITKEGTTRAYVIDLTTMLMRPWGTLPYDNAAGYDGRRVKMCTIGGVPYLVYQRAGAQEFYREAIHWTEAAA